MNNHRACRGIIPATAVAWLVLALAGGGAPSMARTEKQSDAIRYFRLGTVQFEQGKTLDAIESLKKAIKLDPDYDEAHYYLGFIFMQQSEPDQAIKLLKKAIKINPYYTDAHNQLGVAYRDVGKYDKAMREFEAALNDKSYRSPEKIHLNVGYLHLKRGVLPEAIQSFERAVALNPGYLRGIFGLAIAYRASGKTDLAVKEFRRVIDLGPNTPEAAEARQQLGEQGKQAGS